MGQPVMRIIKYPFSRSDGFDSNSRRESYWLIASYHCMGAIALISAELIAMKKIVRSSKTSQRLFVIQTIIGYIDASPCFTDMSKPLSGCILEIIAKKRVFLGNSLPITEHIVNYCFRLSLIAGETTTVREHGIQYCLRDANHCHNRGFPNTMWCGGSDFGSGVLYRVNNFA